MQLKSLISIVGQLESMRDRRLDVMGSWSEREKARRSQAALGSQVTLASLIALLDQNRESAASS